MPFAGVLPWLPGVWLDAEDTLEVGAWRASTARPRAARPAAGRGRPAPPGLQRHRRRRAGRRAGRRRAGHHRPGVVAGADLVVLPGSRSTVERSRVAARARPGRRRRPRAPARRRRCSASAAATRCSASEIEDDVEGRRRRGRRASACCRRRVEFDARRCSAGRPAPGGVTRSTRPTRSTTASRPSGRRGRAVPRRLAGRLGVGHDVARSLRERRLPPGVAGRGRRAAGSRWQPAVERTGLRGAARADDRHARRRPRGARRRRRAPRPDARPARRWWR